MSITSRIQANPEIGSNNGSYVTELIARAKQHITGSCHLPAFPELAQGNAVSAASPSEDISGASSNKFLISVNGSGFYEVEITLGSLNSGAAIATELQTEIRAIDVDGFDEVTVAFADSLYTITSGRYGEFSSIVFSFYEDYKHVCQSLKLSTDYGSIETPGALGNDELETACVMLVERMYVDLGAEGLESGSFPNQGSFKKFAKDPYLSSLLSNNRRMF